MATTLYNAHITYNDHSLYNGSGAAVVAPAAQTVGGGTKWRKRKLQLGVTVRAEAWPTHNRAYRDDDDLLSLL